MLSKGSRLEAETILILNRLLMISIIYLSDEENVQDKKYYICSQEAQV